MIKSSKNISLLKIYFLSSKHRELLIFLNIFFIFIFPAQGCLDIDNPDVFHHQYQIINSYPHDNTAFTQGLVWKDGYFYESTGLYGNSSLRKVEVSTGAVLQKYELPDNYFAEGITIIDNRIYQLTWKEKTGFIYDINTFKLTDIFYYPFEGWGAAYDGTHLIISDGTSVLHFLDPYTLKEIKQVEVFEGKQKIRFINELEYIQGYLYANIWQEEKIAIIEPAKGQVQGWIDLSNILDQSDYTANIDVLNGIAYDNENDYLYVTGKLWPKMFKIVLQ